MRSIRLLALAAVAACAGNGAEPTTPGQSGSPLVEPTLSTVAVTGTGYNNETGAAVNPTDPANAVVAWQVPATVGRTFDGGRTWSSAPLPGVSDWQLAGDPSVVFDGDGHAFALYIAFDPPADYSFLGRQAHRNAILVNRSDDGGRTWAASPTAVIEQPEAFGQVPFEDKPMMAADRTDGPGRGNLYVAWTEFRPEETGILFARSRDGGHSFDQPVEISDHPGIPKDTTGAAEGTDVAVDPDGTVYVVWSDSTGILIDRSTDEGASWGVDIRIARTPDIIFAIEGVARTNGYPSLEIDPRTGRLYVLWVDRRAGAATPYLSYSDDGARTWSAPAPVAGPGGADRFFAWLAVDPATGLVAASYYRTEGTDRLSYVLAWSTDEGSTFRERVWSPAPFRVSGEFLGDYTALDARDGLVYGAWTATGAASAESQGRIGTVVWTGRADFRPPT